MSRIALLLLYLMGSIEGQGLQEQLNNNFGTVWKGTEYNSNNCLDMKVMLHQLPHYVTHVWVEIETVNISEILIPAIHSEYGRCVRYQYTMCPSTLGRIIDARSCVINMVSLNVNSSSGITLKAPTQTINYLDGMRVLRYRTYNDRENEACTSGVCSPPCSEYYWGQTCERTCGMCASYKRCNEIDGTCPTGGTCDMFIVGNLCEFELFPMNNNWVDLVWDGITRVDETDEGYVIEWTTDDVINVPDTYNSSYFFEVIARYGSNELLRTETQENYTNILLPEPKNSLYGDRILTIYVIPIVRDRGMEISPFATSRYDLEVKSNIPVLETSTAIPETSTTLIETTTELGTSAAIPETSTTLIETTTELGTSTAIPETTNTLLEATTELETITAIPKTTTTLLETTTELETITVIPDTTTTLLETTTELVTITAIPETSITLIETTIVLDRIFELSPYTTSTYILEVKSNIPVPETTPSETETTLSDTTQFMEMTYLLDTTKIGLAETTTNTLETTSTSLPETSLLLDTTTVDLPETTTILGTTTNIPETRTILLETTSTSIPQTNTESELVRTSILLEILSSVEDSSTTIGLRKTSPCVEMTSLEYISERTISKETKLSTWNNILSLGSTRTVMGTTTTSSPNKEHIITFPVWVMIMTSLTLLVIILISCTLFFLVKLIKI